MGSITEINSKKIIFFDGYCNLCNSQVNNILSIDKKQIFHYSALSSKFAINTILLLLQGGPVPVYLVELCQPTGQ